MTPIVDRIVAATGKLGEQQNRISTTLSTLAEATRHFDGTSLHQAQEAIPAFTTASHEVSAELAALPDDAKSVVDQEINAINLAANEALAGLTSRWARLEQAFVSLGKTLDPMPLEIAQQLDAFPQLLEAHLNGFSAANAQLVQAIESARASLQGVIVSTIDQSGQDLETALEQVQLLARDGLSGRMKGLGNDGQAGLQKSFGDMSQLVGQGEQKLNQTVEAAFYAFMHEVTNAINQKLPDAQGELVNHAVRALAEEVGESIAMSTVGAEISVSLSPYIIQLIALKELLEALLQAIRLFKNPLEEIF